MTDWPPPKFCGICGAEVWPLVGTDVLTCRRGHHQPNHWTHIPYDPEVGWTTSTEEVR